MTKAVALDPLFLSNIAKLRDWLDLLAMLRDFREPIDSPAGLRRAIELLLRVGETLGLETAWLGRVRGILDDPRIFELTLAVVRFLSGLVSPTPSVTPQPIGAIRRQSADGNLAAQAIDFNQLLAIIAEILLFLQRLRAPK